MNTRIWLYVFVEVFALGTASSHPAPSKIIQNVEIVDTTCPWVSKVWNTVDMHQRKGLTSVIHGKYGHEETVATTSFCEDYICVKNMKEAEMVADYIVNGGDRDEFLKYFEKAVSKGFDPNKLPLPMPLASFKDRHIRLA